MAVPIDGDVRRDRAPPPPTINVLTPSIVIHVYLPNGRIARQCEGFRAADLCLADKGFALEERCASER
jgi:hypothetical protein